VENNNTGATILATGMLASDTEARLAFKTGGIIRKMYADEGDRVQKGQLLAQLQLTEIQAQVTQAEYGVEKARRDLERVQNLYRDSAATLEQVQNLNTVLDLAKQNLEIARFNLQYSEIRAPQAGVIIKKMASEGELAAPGMPVLVMNGSGPSNWIARVSVSDKDWALISTGDAAQIRLDAYPDEVFSGRVQLVAPTADPMNGLYPIEIKINARDKRFAPGLFAKAILSPGKAATGSGGVRIPVEAIVEGDGKRAFVFVPDGNGGVRKIPVLIGELTNTHAVVVQGMEGVEAVITAGSPYLSERSRVRVVR
jgi:RND family efflux transporter MFP subunit